MALLALPHQDKISQATTSRAVILRKEIQFGNGYSLRAPDGLNSVKKDWSVVWSDLDNTDSASLYSSLIDPDSVFQWTALNETTQGKYVVDIIRKEHNDISTTISASFRRVYDV